jgi:hypothetical protein
VIWTKALCLDVADDMIKSSFLDMLCDMNKASFSDVAGDSLFFGCGGWINVFFLDVVGGWVTWIKAVFLDLKGDMN